MKRLIAAVAAAIIAVLTLPAAVAAPGSFQDPQGDTTYKTDIRTVTHSDDADSVTYHIQFWNDVDNNEWVGNIVWDFDENGSQDGYAQVGLQYDDFVITYNQQTQQEVDRNGRASRAPSGEPGSTAANTVKVVVPLASMRGASMAAGDSGYNYYVWFGNPQTNEGDATSEETFHIRHELGGTANPTAVPGTPPPSTPTPLQPAPTLVAPAPPAVTPAPATQATPAPADPTPEPEQAPAPEDEVTGDTAGTTAIAQPETTAASPPFQNAATRSGRQTMLVAGAVLVALGSAGGLAFAKWGPRS